MSKELWHWELRGTNLFTPPQTKETKSFKCPVCFQNFKKAYKRNLHLRVKHPIYKGPKFVPQAVKHNVHNQGSDARPIGRRSRKRRKRKEKDTKKIRKTRKNRRQLGLPVLLVKNQDQRENILCRSV